MKINGEKINPTTNYTFILKGNYTILFLLDLNNANSLDNMFKGIKNLVSINFYQKFNTEKIKYMNCMFENCESLYNVDISYFNTENVISMDHMFASCTSLSSINFQKLNFNNLETLEYMFHRSSIKSVDFSNLNFLKLKKMNYICFLNVQI